MYLSTNFSRLFYDAAGILTMIMMITDVSFLLSLLQYCRFDLFGSTYFLEVNFSGLILSALLLVFSFLCPVMRTHANDVILIVVTDI